MKRDVLARLVIMAVIVMLASSPAFAAVGHEHMHTAGKMTPVDLRLTLRDLWTGHIFWVRNVVFATAHGDAAEAKVAEENVVKNARSIADAVALFYGKEAGDKLFSLLAAHYGAVREYLTAAIAGDSAAKGKAVDTLKANATEIATFLSSANPKNWPKETLVGLLMTHGGHHISQIDAVVAKDYGAEATVEEAMKMHIYTIADALAGGIVKQFPKKF